MALFVQNALAMLVVTARMSFAYDFPTHGAVGAMDSGCLSHLDGIFNGWYLLTALNSSQDTREDPWPLTEIRRLGCRLSILESLQSATSDGCPSEEQLRNCFWVAADEWKEFVKTCPLMDSLKPLPACSDMPGEAAEGIPPCSDAQKVALAACRRLLHGGPANDAGIATWQFSNGEAQGLQYDHFAFPGSPVAQPPNVAQAAGVTGVDAAALGAINEGDEGGTVAGGADVVSTSGCFPGIWTPEEFEQYLNGTLVERPRPKDYGGVNAVGLVSVCVYTILLSSLAFL